MAITDNNGTQYYAISCGVPSDGDLNVNSNNGSRYMYKVANDYILWGQEDFYPGLEDNNSQFPYYYQCYRESDPWLDLENNNGTAFYYNSACNCITFCEDPFIDVDTILRLESDYGILKTGGDPAGLFDLVNTITNRGTASDATQPTSGSQGFYLPLVADKGYAYFPGVAGNYLKTVDSASIHELGDFCLEWRGRLTTVNAQIIATCVDGGGFPWSFYFDSANLVLNSSTFGLLFQIIADITSYRGIRVFRELDVIRVFVDDGTGFVQLGADVSVTSAPFPASSAPLYIGASDTGAFPCTGHFQTLKIWNSVNITDDPVLDIDFTDPAIPDNALSFEAATGQTVTVHQTGNNPATLVRIPRIRLDGVDDGYVGTFLSPLTSGRSFAVFSRLGIGGPAYARVFTMYASGENDFDNIQSLVWSLRDAGTDALGTYGDNSLRYSHTDGYLGSHIHEVLASDGELHSWIDGGDEKSVIYDTPAISSDVYRIGMDHSGGSNGAIDIFAQVLIPADTPDAKVEGIRNYLINEYFKVVYIHAPEGALAGADLVVQGGISPYQFIVNGTPVGSTFTGPNTTIPLTVVEGDEVRVVDSNGKQSNMLVATDPLALIAADFDIRTHLGHKIPYGINLTADGENAVIDGIIGEITSAAGKRFLTKYAADGTPYLYADGVDDEGHTGIDAPSASFSYAFVGRFRSTSVYPPLIGSPPGGVTFGGNNGSNTVGINRLGATDPLYYLDVGTNWFAFVVTCGEGTISYHARILGDSDYFVTDQPDIIGGYGNSGELTIAGGHGGALYAAADIIGVRIKIGAKWTSEEMAATVNAFSNLLPSP